MIFFIINTLLNQLSLIICICRNLINQYRNSFILLIKLKDSRKLINHRIFYSYIQDVNNDFITINLARSRKDQHPSDMVIKLTLLTNRMFLNLVNIKEMDNLPSILSKEEDIRFQDILKEA